jgi:hypothetical protein
MKDYLKEIPIEQNEQKEPEKPFVNEECGDTMWDAVLDDIGERTILKLWDLDEEIEMKNHGSLLR